MIADCHMHTEFSSDSETKMTAQVERAIELGIPHICFTDHMDMDYPGGEFQLDTDAYVKRVLEVKELYRDKINICLGVEVGLQEHLKERLQEYIDKYPFDFVIGSMHLIYGEDPYFGKIFDRVGDEDAYREYFRATLENLKNAPEVQTLGHLDYVVRYGKEKDKAYSYRKFADEIDEILKLVIEKGMALEMNTAGLRMLSFPNPHPDVIRRYRELGGEMITVGSDGHTPEVLAYGFDRVPELLKSCGFEYYTVFQGKKPQFIRI
ncbi:MAG: histidinol-phosphatase HisJ family protein [Erysipelotrichaceae bacterium]|nr:histidinol-phosphatase HisJ family protein [Erysipelotrichaceae bacterium]